ncbi:MAG: homoserine kinase [Acidobacteria bacterium RIFCSPLOWO2_12_FULL_59_11]|nr:MAG: homoserine kinase [Acidobacteria bacterium RIFCSPLOWO2_12_FULL_59_11]
MVQPSAIRVRVPASSANLGPGFDTLALALGLYLRCTLRKSRQGFRIEVSGTDTASIPRDESNLIWKAFTRLAGEQAKPGVILEIVNEVPIGKGLGSSAAAIVAGLALANEWLEWKQSKDQLIAMATAMEGHPDNVAAAVRGGLVISCQAEDGTVIALNSSIQANLEVALVVPQCQLSTEVARAALPAHYSRRDAVFNLQRVALLLAALREGHQELLAEAMRDRFHQPYRAPLVPGFPEILELRGVPGLLGLALSGAGPSVVAFCSGHTSEVGEAIASCFRKHGIETATHRLPIDSQGLVVERVS